MKAKELLKPRFEIIANFPDNHYGEIGTVLDRNWSKYPDDDETKKPIWSISDFPHLFKELNWWEYLKESEMPSYLKHTVDKENWTYHKIEKWNMDSLDGFISVEKREVCSLLSWSKEYTYQPATEQEYLDSLNSMK